MKKIANALIAILILSAATQPAPATAAGKDQVHVIRDEFGFEQPMDALTMTLPEGWDVSGAVQWYGRPTCDLDQMKLHFMATAPDGKEWVEFIPGGAWGWSSYFDAVPYQARQGFVGCDARPIRDIRTFVNQYIPTIRPGAQIVSMRPRPDQAREIFEAMGDVRLQPGQRPRMEVMEVRVAYEANGHRISELLMPAILFIDQPGPDPYGGMSGYVTVAMMIGTITSAKVGGTADESLAKMVGDSMQPNDAYMARLARHYQERSRLMEEAGRRRHAAQQAWLASRRAVLASSSSGSRVDTSGSDILDIQMDTWKNTTAMKDAGQSSSVDMIHERKPWLNADGRTIYMPQQYQRAYQLPNDVYAGTNDAFFNPVQATGQFGEPMREGRY